MKLSSELNRLTIVLFFLSANWYSRKKLLVANVPYILIFQSGMLQKTLMNFINSYYTSLGIMFTIFLRYYLNIRRFSYRKSLNTRRYIPCYKKDWSRSRKQLFKVEISLILLHYFCICFYNTITIINTIIIIML